MVRGLLSLALAWCIGLGTSFADDAAKAKKPCGAKAAAEKPAGEKTPAKCCEKPPAKPAVARVVVGAGGRAVATLRPQAYYSLPGYWSLQSESVQKELKLSDQQKEKLKAISKKYYEQMREGYGQQWAKIREMAPEERKKKYEEIAAKRKQQTAALRKQIEEVLQGKQLDALKMIELRNRGTAALRNPKVAEHLGLSDEQKEKLRQNQQDVSKKIQKIQRSAAEKALQVLTPEQLEKLKGLHAKGYRTIWSQSR